MQTEPLPIPQKLLSRLAKLLKKYEKAAKEMGELQNELNLIHDQIQKNYENSDGL